MRYAWWIGSVRDQRTLQRMFPLYRSIATFEPTKLPVNVLVLVEWIGPYACGAPASRG